MAFWLHEIYLFWTFVALLLIMKCCRACLETPGKLTKEAIPVVSKTCLNQIMHSHHTKEMQNEPGDELMYPNMESRLVHNRINNVVKPLYNYE